MIKLLQNIRSENQCFCNINLFWVKKNNACKGTKYKSKKRRFQRKAIFKNSNSVKSEEQNLGIKFIKNIDVNIENIKEGYIDDDEDDDKDDGGEGEEEEEHNTNTNNGKSSYNLKVNHSISLEESNNKNQNNENDSYKEDALNNSNSSINTKVYKLNDLMELFIKRDIMNDEDINIIDGLQNNNNKSEQKIYINFYYI